MKNIKDIKKACEMQRKVRRCEEEGMVMAMEGFVTRGAWLGFLELEEALECLTLLGHTEEQAHDMIRKVWVD